MTTSRRWAAGITAAPRQDSALAQCVESVVANGWEPVVFAEPGTDLSGLAASVAIVKRPERLGAWHNWLVMCRELMGRFPDAEAVLTVQDDTEIVPRAREFLESQGLWPGDPANVGFVSLYTPSHYQCRYHVLDERGRRVGDMPNELRARQALAKHKEGRIRRAPKASGCMQVATHSLWGACALAFPRASLERIVAHRIAERWRGASGRQRGAEVKNVDTAIGQICNALKLGMWFWNPSLSQHVARYSTLGHSDNTGKRAAAYVAVDPFRDCLPPNDAAASLDGSGFWWVSNNDLDHIVADLCSRLPADISSVAGVPRSGLLPAYLVAKHLHIPMVPIETCLGMIARPYRPSVSRKLRETGRGRVLVIDDSVNSGKTWDEIGSRIRVPHYRAAAIVTEVGKSRVDFWGAALGNPHCFHWQWLACVHARRFVLDMDGVICEDWSGDWREKDAERYAEFLENARPLHLPRVPVMAIVTGRLERFRPQTEAWLRRHGVEYGTLLMNSGERKHAEFKADAYGSLGGALCFVESNRQQAAEIHERTGRPVLSVETWEMLGAAPLSLPPRIGMVPHAEKIA